MSGIKHINEYQLRKARVIVAFLVGCQQNSTLTRHQLAQVVAIMDAEQWQKVAFSAGVPVADIKAKAAVLALLRNREIHCVS
jgi:hypothetical protein